MERLNDIMMRTAQRRQETQEHRSSQEGTPSQGPRPKQPLTHRAPLPEQTARLDQQNPLGVHQPQSQYKRAQYPSSPGMGNRGEPGARRSQQHNTDQILRQREIDRRPAYHQRPQQPIQKPQHFVSEQKEAEITSDYYDAYPMMPPADVQGDWEDDAENMHYGDWEAEGSYDIHPPSPTERDVTFVAPAVPQDARWSSSRVSAHLQARALQKTRELSSIPALDPAPRSPLTRNFREARVSQAQSPIPQALPQERQSHHRNTQPLNSRAIIGVSQASLQEESLQQPARQVVAHEQLQQHLPVFIPPPMLPKSICSKCKGAGYLRVDVPFGHPNFGKPIPCECKEADRREKRRQQLRNISNLEAFKDKTFRTFNSHVPGVQEAYRVALEYAQNPDGWLLLLGPNGCGKTHLAAAIANQSLNDGALVLFAVVPDLFFDLRASFAPTATESHEQLFFRMREAELLVLDDLGAQKSSPWTAEKLFQLLNYRYNSGFPTVITANLDGLHGIDERIRSRLNDVCLVNRIRLDRAHDYRPNNPRRK